MKNYNNVKMMVNKASFYFQKCFVNGRNELILEPRNNIYFRLDDIETEEQFAAKVLAYCSRGCTKGLSDYWQDYMLRNVNTLLDTDFSKKEMSIIYTYFGGDHKKENLIKFIENDMSMNWLREVYKEDFAKWEDRI